MAKETNSSNKPHIPGFLKNAGESGELILEHDWKHSPLGPIENWPLSLRSTLGIVLQSGFPMVLIWGPELIFFYNDAYRPSLGNDGRHPAIGKSAREIWLESYEYVEHLINKVIIQGEKIWLEDQLIPIYRDGKYENVYWTFSYTPAYGDHDEIAGIFISVLETTQKVKDTIELQENRDQLKFAIEATELATWEFNPVTNKFHGNERLKEWFGADTNSEIEMHSVFSTMPESDQKMVKNAFLKAQEYSSGGNLDIEYTIIHPQTGLHRHVRSKGRAWFNEDKIAYRLNGTLQDITEQKKADEMLKKSNDWYQLVNQATQDAIWDWDLINESIRWNDRVFSMFNFKEEDVKPDASWWIENIYYEDREDVLQSIHKVIDSGEVHWSAEYRFNTGDGGFRFVQDRGFVLHDNSGKPIRMIGSMQDITERKNAEKEQQKQIALLENSRDFIGISDFEGNALFVNQEGRKIVGIDPQFDITKTKILDYFHLEQQEFIKSTVLPAVFSKGSWTGETKFRNFKTGEQIPVTWNVFIIKDLKTGNPIGLGCLSQNLTERLKVEKDLIDSEQKVRSFIDSAPFPIGVYTGKEMVIQYANNAILEAWGKGKDVLGKKYADVLPELKQSKIFQQLESVFLTGVPVHAKYQQLKLIVDGKPQEYYFNYSFTPLYNTEGKIYGVMNTAADVTDLALAAKKIQESEERFRTMAEGSEFLIAVYDEDGKAVYFNKAWLDLTGKSLKELLNVGWSGIIHPEDKEKYTNQFQSAFKNKETFEGEFRVISKNGEYRWLLVRRTPRFRPDGSFAGYISSCIDITERKEAEKTLEKNNKQLIRINNDLDNFIYTASHDLKAPMSNIEGLLHALNVTLEQYKNEEVEKILELMEKSINRFKKTILDLTEISKAQKEAVEDINEICLEEIMEDVKQTIANKIVDSGAKIHIDFSEAPTVKFSSKNIQSILYNLISNALKYQHPERHPEISVKTEKTHSHIVLTVKDNGLGIDPANINKIFSMFKRFHDHVEGTGIGLYIVKRIIDNAGGKIEVESEEGKGTVFKIYFPIESPM